MSIGKALKYDNNKPNLALIPKEAMWHMGQALAYGASKYGADNFKEGMQIRRSLAAALRHIYQFLDGENIDAESGCNHLGNAMASLAMACYTLENRPEFDDRYVKPKPASTFPSNAESGIDLNDIVRDNYDESK